MAPRVQVILSEQERDALHAQAARDGESLSAWMRDAAHQRLHRVGERAHFASVEALDAFFEECDLREQGDDSTGQAEPDWELHRAAIDASSGSGSSGT